MGYRSIVVIATTKNQFIRNIKPILKKKEGFMPTEFYKSKDDKEVICYWKWVNWGGDEDEMFWEPLSHNVSSFIRVGEESDVEFNGTENDYLYPYVSIDGFQNYERTNIELEDLGRKYDNYKKQWIKDHITPERIKDLYLKYVEHNLGYDCFDTYLAIQGFGGECYASFNEWLDMEAKDGNEQKTD